MTKCLRIKSDKCSQCKCIVNNAIYSHAISGEVIKSKSNDATSIPILFTKLLAAVTSGDIDFASWFDVGGNASVGMYITIHPDVLGFMSAVILSIAAPIIVSSVEENDSIERHRNASSLEEALENAGVEKNQRTQLFAIEGKNKGRLTRLLAFICGIGLIPLVFLASEFIPILIFVRYHSWTTLNDHVKMFKYSIAGLRQELILM